MTLTSEERKGAQVKQASSYAIVAITKHGVELGRKLHRKFHESDLYYPRKFEKGDEQQHSIQMFEGSVRPQVPILFKQYKGLIFIVSLGAVVRLIAPFLKDKREDPGVVVMDEKGENVISVLSGHLGGANELANEVAEILGARPIITTASEVQKTIPVDLLGKKFGWVYDSDDKLIPVSASVVNEERIAIIQESGEKNWWNYDRPLPSNMKVYETVQDALKDEFDASLVITHRLLRDDEQEIIRNGVVYRPKVIAIGMGCNRGTSSEEIEAVIIETLNELDFSIKSVKALCTVDLKKDEEGLLEVVNRYGWEFKAYTPRELNSIEIEQPSETVFKFTGAYGVSEPAARLYSGTENLALVKKKSGNVTISVGVIPSIGGN